MQVDSSPSPSSSASSPSNDFRTRHSRMPEPDLDKVASLAQKLYESLKALKSSKNKTNVSIPVSEFDDIISRSQQVALLTSASRRSRDDTISLISEMSERISGQLANLESKLENASPSHGTSGIGAESIATQPPAPAAKPATLDGIRHGSLYLTDGNLVVAAPISEGGIMLFRVHQSMLSLQSPVFAAMFTLPSPDTNRDMYDGVPFVRMPDDTKDIESLLKVLYNPSELPYRRLDPFTPINVRRTLAMATKYEMDGLRDRIVTQLQADWPQSLVEWDRLETEISCIEEEHEEAEDDDYVVRGLHLDERLPEPAAAIRLAIDFNIPRVVPSAVYHLSRLKTGDNWSEPYEERSNLMTRTARWDLLEAADMKLVLKVRELIAGYYHHSLRLTPGACGSDTCAAQWRETSSQWQLARDPLEVMKKFAVVRPRDLCKKCWNALIPKVQQSRFTIWDEIGEYAKTHNK